MIRDLALDNIRRIVVSWLRGIDLLLTQPDQETFSGRSGASMAPRSGRVSQTNFHKVWQQDHLRMSCKLGNLPEVALALNPQGGTWWKLAKWMFSYLSTGAASLEEPADLCYVYNDDIGNMAIHYIALGSKPTL